MVVLAPAALELAHLYLKLKEQKVQQVTLVTMVSQMTRKTHTRLIPTSKEKIEQWFAWDRRPGTPYVQDFFPELDDADREFLLTGITPDEWATLEIEDED